MIIQGKGASKSRQACPIWQSSMSVMDAPATIDFHLGFFVRKKIPQSFVFLRHTVEIEFQVFLLLPSAMVY